MVPPDSDRAPPTPPYSGSGLGSTACRVRGCHPLRPAFPGVFPYAVFVLHARPSTPRAPRRPRFGLAPFRSPLLGGSLLFSFPPTTWMFRFVGLASAYRRMPRLRAAGSPIRASADPWLLAPPRGLSRPAAPFLAPGSLGIPRAPYLARSPPGYKARGPLSSIARVSLVSLVLLSRVSLASTTGTRASWRDDRVVSLLLCLPHPVNEPRRPKGACVENVGLEPTTPGLQSRCSSQLSQSPSESA